MPHVRASGREGVVQPPGCHPTRLNNICATRHWLRGRKEKACLSAAAHKKPRAASVRGCRPRRLASGKEACVTSRLPLLEHEPARYRRLKRPSPLYAPTVLSAHAANPGFAAPFPWGWFRAGKRGPAGVAGPPHYVGWFSTTAIRRRSPLTAHNVGDVCDHGTASVVDELNESDGSRTLSFASREPFNVASQAALVALPIDRVKMLSRWTPTNGFCRNST